MKLRDVTGYTSAPARIITVLTILLIGLLILQTAVHGGILMLIYASDDPTPAKLRLTAQQAQQQRIVKSDKEFLPDGTCHLVHTTTRTDNQTKSLDEVQVYDMSDKLLWSGKRHDLPQKYVRWSHGLSPRRYSTAITATYLSGSWILGPEFSRQLTIPIVSANGEVIERWRYDCGRDIFTGYDSGQRLIGYFGSDGLAPSQSKAGPFGQFVLMHAWCPKGSLNIVVLWQTRSRVYQINFAERTVDILFDLPGQVIADVRVNNWQNLHTDNTDNRPSIHVVTKSGECHVLLRDPQQRLRFKVPEDFSSRTVRIAAIGNRVFLRYQRIKPRYVSRGRADRNAYWKWREKHRNDPRQYHLELRQIDESGVGPLVGSFDWTEPPRPFDPKGQRRAELLEVASRYVTAPSPAAYSLAWYLYYKDVYRSCPAKRGLNNVLSEVAMRYQSQSKVLNWPLSLLMVGVVFWHGWPRRTCWAKFVFWLVFTGLFSLAGLLTYWSLNHTPVIRCAACGKKRGLGIPTCRACKGVLPPPKPRDVDLIMTRS